VLFASSTGAPLPPSGPLRPPRAQARAERGRGDRGPRLRARADLQEHAREAGRLVEAEGQRRRGALVEPGAKLGATVGGGGDDLAGGRDRGEQGNDEQRGQERRARDQGMAAHDG